MHKKRKYLSSRLIFNVYSVCSVYLFYQNCNLWSSNIRNGVQYDNTCFLLRKHDLRSKRA
jgi:hypothetical protein